MGKVFIVNFFRGNRLIFVFFWIMFFVNFFEFFYEMISIVFEYYV